MLKKVVVLSLVLLMLTGLTLSASRISVGSKNFTEQYVVSEMIAMLLEANGFQVDKNFGMSSFAVRSALTTGQVDIYAEYTGTAWLTYLEQTEVINDPDRLYELVRDADAQNGIVWLPPAEINNTYALAITREYSNEYGIRTLSDLARHMDEGHSLIMGVGFEFFDRPDGFRAMVDDYGMDVPPRNVRTMEIGLTYEAIARGSMDVAMVFATDGKLERFQLVVLEDDRQFFPVYTLAVTIREEVLEAHPEIEEILSPLAIYLNETLMIRLNYLVDGAGMEPGPVAEHFLKGLGLI